MKLTYNELKKREVINMADGKSFGHITDIELDFPKGILTGITVQGRKVCALFSFFNRSKLFIPQSEIIKIGGDAILVNVKCGGSCSPNVNLANQNSTQKKNCSPPCPPPCPPCPPPCPPTYPHKNIPSISDILPDDYDDM